MNFLVQWGINPWGEDTLIHAQWGLVYVAFAFGVGFMLAHTLFVKFWPKPAGPATAPVNEAAAARVPAAREAALACRADVPLDHGGVDADAARHVVRADPRAAVRLGQIHWIAGLVLTVSIVYHIIHASFWLDFWSIWLNKEDASEAITRFKRAMGGARRRRARPRNIRGTTRCITRPSCCRRSRPCRPGLFMMNRVETPLFVRNPYLFSDTTWGVMYVLHGLSGIGLVGLTIAHIYFAIRPEKLWITKGMVFGDISRQEFLQHHDPRALGRRQGTPALLNDSVCDR